ncbi:MAG: ABC transporter ATP-binding protein [Nitrospinota bacterium]
MLEIKGLRTGYGNIAALQGISLSVAEGQIVALIGANGAGKTTTLKTVTGLLRPWAGSISFQDMDLATRTPAEIVSLGISLVPEGRRIFSTLTMLENLKMGAFLRWDRSRILREVEEVLELFPALRGRARQKGGSLSGGEQQMLAIARALMSKPKLLLLDEPSMGLAPRLIETVFRILRDIRDRGTTVLLVEQNARMALALADEGYVIETGKIVLHDTASKLRENPEVRRAYLGGRTDGRNPHRKTAEGTSAGGAD